MDLATALKSGVLPNTANPIDIILTAHKEGLTDLLQKQIPRHHQIMQRSRDVAEARTNFQVVCDFTDSEIINMVDLHAWSEEGAISPVDMSSSVFIDDSARGMQSSLGIMRSLRRKKIHRPIDDSMVTQCYNCSTDFGTFHRKHHCRACGRIFCYNCSQWRECIPADLISYTDLSRWIKTGQAQRVCQSCHDMIESFRKVENLVRYFEIVAFPFELCVRAATLSRDWREAMRIYLSNIRDIQYLLPSAPLSDRDRRALQSNLPWLQGHSKWLIQGLKMGLVKTDGIRIKPCHEMMCDRNCTEGLSAFDAIIILNTPLYNPEVKSLALRLLGQTTFPSDVALFLPMEDLLVQDFILKRPDLFLDFFWLSRINQGLAMDVFKNKLMLANQDQALSVQESIRLISMLEGYTTVYSLSQQLQSLQVPFMGPFGMITKFDTDVVVKNSATRPIVVKYYSDGGKRAFLYKQEDVRKDAHVVALIRLMYYLCADIFEVPEETSFLPTASDPITISRSRRDSAPWFTRDSPMSSPNSHSSYPTVSNLSVPSLITPPSSSFPAITSIFPPPPPPPPPSSPVIESPLLALMQSGSSTASIDSFVKSVGESPSQSPLSRSLPAELVRSTSSVGSVDMVPVIENTFLATYRVMPISVNAGFIEIVQNAQTLTEILTRGTISNYLYRSNANRRVSEVSSNYSASLAFWTVVSYILGVGDRHLENIMIRSDGILFHIDYGFVFGADTTASPIRLDKDLIEGLGGTDMYEPFKERCCEIYCSLRRHFNFICSCLLRLASIQPPIKGYNFTPEFIERFITARFLLGQTEDEAKDAFSKIINSSRETISRRVSDLMHSTMSTLKLSWWRHGASH